MSRRLPRPPRYLSWYRRALTALSRAFGLLLFEVLQDSSSWLHRVAVYLLVAVACELTDRWAYADGYGDASYAAEVRARLDERNRP